MRQLKLKRHRDDAVQEIDEDRRRRATGSARRDDSQWVAALRGPPAVREEALADLHALLLRGARFELSRSRRALRHVPNSELDAIAMQAADDALGAILAKLDTFRGTSRFTTWASKFVLLEAGVKSRRRAWEGREINREVEACEGVGDGASLSQQTLHEAESLRAIRDEAQISLTPHQREVFAALALNGVPIDVLADRLSTTRGALYQTLQDARRKLRAALLDAGLAPRDSGAQARPST